MKYAETISICQLKRDLEILPSGDQTEIGEKGINLSGGQKARIGLARAVYADRDLFLMDDPLSALDANVKKQIFKKVFLSKLAQKTRVLVTHAVEFLHLADSIIYLKDGKIDFQGKFDDCQEHPYVKELLSIHNANKAQQLQSITEEGQKDSDDEEEADIKDDNGQSITSEGQRKQSGHMTTNENDQQSRVDLQVYKKYQKYVGGWTQFILINVTMTLLTLSRVSGEFLVGHWSESDEN